MIEVKEKEPKKAEVPAQAQVKNTSEDYFADFDFANLKIDLGTMLKAGVHFGHQNSRRNPKMEPYIHTTRKGINIIDLQKTQELLEEALGFIKSVKESGKKILFVGTKKQFYDVVKSAAKKCGMPYVVDRWLGGTFTNFKVIRGRTKYLKGGLEKMEKGEFKMYTKFEQAKIAEELRILEKKMGGIMDMEELPAAIIITDAKEDGLAVKEANKVGIPVVGIVDTNCDPSNIDYPIPANDDAISSMRLVLGYLCKAIIE
jgi:small subunit ribosomal protein S2